MTPKEKAIYLVNQYLQIYDGRVIEAKQCAIIAVDEILENCKFENYNCGYLTKTTYHKIYWQEVKEEIKNL